jgi:Xaa-Pro aminopeptidase
MVKHRRSKAVDILKIHGLDAMLFTDMVNIRYLTGFTGSDGALIFADTDSTFLCDSRYTTQATQQLTCEVVEYKKKLQDLVDLLRQKGYRKVGFESSVVSYAEFSQLKKIAGTDIEWIDVDDLSALRIIKDESEIALIEQATSLSAQAFNDVLPSVVSGVCESEIALALEIAIRKHGGEEKSFDFIVASGIRGALPHGVASDKKIENSDLVTIDYGGRYRGYYSDETVTFAVGQSDATIRKVYDIVLEAHDRAIAKIKPGIAFSEIDAAARDYISSSGYGANFGHGLGHGVGLEVHEAPRISPLSKGLTEVGMVFTVEPGIYLPGLGGVRIEDIVVVTADGCRILTRLPKKYRTFN